MLECMAKRLPVGRIGQPADIADAIMALMQNGFITGTIFHVDEPRTPVHRDRHGVFTAFEGRRHVRMACETTRERPLLLGDAIHAVRAPSMVTSPGGPQGFSSPPVSRDPADTFRRNDTLP